MVFKGESFVKVGITHDHIVKRIYNYGFGFNKYINCDIDFKKSYVFKTNDSDIEKKVLKQFKKERIGRSESIKLAPIDIELFLKQETILNPKNHYVKKQLFDFLPFDNHDEFKHEFILKINQFVDFESRYLDYLEIKGLKNFYNQNYDDIRSFYN